MRQSLHRRLKLWYLAVLLNAIRALTHVTLAQAQDRKTPKPLVLDGVTVVDVIQGKLIPDQRVVILGTRIKKVAPAKAVRVPVGAQIISATGKFLIPGLWDMHAHTNSASEMFPLLVANGVTGIREMSADWPQGFDSIVQRRQEIASGALIGPRVLATAHDFYTPVCHEYAERFRAYLTAIPSQPGCYALNDNTVTSPEEIRRWVDTLHAHHVDFVKAHEVGDSAIYLAMLNEARRVGIPSVGHLGGHEGRHVQAIEASDSGLKSVEHIDEMECWQDEKGDAAPDSIAERRCREVARHFLRNKTWSDPTLYIFKQIDDAPVYQSFKHAVGLLYRAGVPLVAGTDMSTEGNYESLAKRAGALQSELAELVDAGVPPLEVLRAATINPAKLFAAMDSLGTIAAGKIADCVLLNANPLADFHNMRTIQAVIANGRYLNRAKLDTLISAANGKP